MPPFWHITLLSFHLCILPLLQSTTLKQINTDMQSKVKGLHSRKQQIITKPAVNSKLERLSLLYTHCQEKLCSYFRIKRAFHGWHVCGHLPRPSPRRFYGACHRPPAVRVAVWWNTSEICSRSRTFLPWLCYCVSPLPQGRLLCCSSTGSRVIPVKSAPVNGRDVTRVDVWATSRGHSWKKDLVNIVLLYNLYINII